MREFIGKSLYGEPVIYIRHRAQPPDANVCLRRTVLNAKIRNVIRHIRPALRQMWRISVHRIDVKYGRDRRKHRALQPGRRLAVGIQRSLHVHRRDRIVVIELNVVLARPHNFHRTPNFARQNCRFGDVVRFRLPSEPSAQECDVADHVLFADPEFA